MAAGAKLQQPAREARAKDLLSFMAFVAVGAGAAAAQWWLVGPPALPSFDLDYLQHALTRSEVSSGDAISVARTVGWAALLYLGFTTALRLMIGLACRLTDGATW